MLNYIVRNLITAVQLGNIDVFAHQANCMCTMKSGIAPQITKAFPEMQQADDRTVSGDFSKLGRFTKATLKEIEGVVGYNLYGQYDWRGRKNTDYNALKNALEALNDDLVFSSIIALPKLGAGLGGGDWNVISEIIEKTIGEDHHVEIYVLNSKEIPNV